MGKKRKEKHLGRALIKDRFAMNKDSKSNGDNYVRIQ
jgi:hypothetical protein